MPPFSFRTVLVAALTAAATFGPARPAAARQAVAQTSGVERAEGQPAAPPVVARDARETRNELEGLLKRMPPSVGRVLRLDPSLMRNQSYLAPYPALAEFLQAHPEVVSNPGYYLENVSVQLWNPADPRAEAIQMWRGAMEGLALFTVLGTVTLVVVWLLRTLVEYRRWSRVSRVQAEVHNKLLDRFTSNEELLAYVQTPPGRRFLESAPLPIDGPARPVGAPFGRILWSVQAGIVLAVAALGLMFISTRAIEEVAQVLFAVGVLALAVGIGFVVSAVASFLLSRRLGLLEPLPAREHGQSRA